MQISLEQFAMCFPNASAETRAALFTRAQPLGPRTIDRILADHGITELHVVAQFLTACSLASNGFTNFDRPVFGLALLDWLTARAREWRDAGANEDAAAWLWLDLIDRIAVLFGVPDTYWNEVHRTLAAVCAALGVEDRSESVLPEGADEEAAGNG